MTEWTTIGHGWLIYLINTDPMCVFKLTRKEMAVLADIILKHNFVTENLNKRFHHAELLSNRPFPSPSVSACLLLFKLASTSTKPLLGYGLLQSCISNMIKLLSIWFNAFLTYSEHCHIKPQLKVTIIKCCSKSQSFYRVLLIPCKLDYV